MPPLLPLFPLQLVVFPGNDVPLHIFEDRYKEMVGEAEAAGTEFGIILAKDNGIVNAGCTVRVETVLQRYPDGRFDVMTRGERRFEVASLNQERAYLRGVVTFFEDEDWKPVEQGLRDRALAAFQTLKEALAGLGKDLRDSEPDPEHPNLSFQLAPTIDDLDFQSRLLRSRSESERLTQFSIFTHEYISRQQSAEKLKRATATNGFGHKHLDL